MNRFLRLDKLTPRTLWENVHEDIVPSQEGFVLFDDVVLDKRHSREARLVRRQWSGNEKRVIYGIGVVACVYVNPETKQFWVIYFRVYDPEGDEQSKIEHMLEMFNNISIKKNLAFRTVLMDSWYASMQVIKHIEASDKIYYCPLKTNRYVDDSETQSKHKRIDKLIWTDEDQQTGKTIHLKKMPKGHRMKLFRLVLSNKRTDYVITNDITQEDSDVVKNNCAVRWKIEQFHREAKQITGLEGCQCRITRALRNHIAYSFLVWAQLKRVAEQQDTNVYRLKFGLLEDYMKQ